MRTEEHHRIYRREGDGHPSDLRDAEWRGWNPAASPGGRPRKSDMRAAIHAILFAAHRLPQALSAPATPFRRARRSTTSFASCVWEAIWAELHVAMRERMGREASPSAAVLDSQSVKSACACRPPVASGAA